MNSIANRTRLGFFIAFALLLFSNLLTFISTQKVIGQDQRASRTNKVIHNLDNVLQFTYASEAHIYKNRSLETINAGTANSKYLLYADSLFHDLSILIKDDPSQIENLKELRSLTDENFRYLSSIDTAGASERGGAQGITPLQQRLENQIVKMQNRERAALNADDRDVVSYAGWIKFFNIISIVIAILLTLFSLVVYNKENRDKKEEARKAVEFREQLEKRVEELAKLNKELIDLRSLEKYAMTGRIARTIAHEVRNPLTNINLSIEQLKAEMPHDEMADMFLAMMQRNSERINQLVSDLLSATRVSELHFTLNSVNELIEESLLDAADRIGLKHIHVEKNFAPQVPDVKVDAEKIKVVFLNIIVNAIEAMKEEGTLRISTSYEKDKCIIKFKDTGNGMDTDQLNKLFEPYFTTKQKGNGLGLANSQNIILAHNGNVRVESVLGQGAEFTVILPNEDKE